MKVKFEKIADDVCGGIVLSILFMTGIVGFIFIDTYVKNIIILCILCIINWIFIICLILWLIRIVNRSNMNVKRRNVRKIRKRKIKKNIHLLIYCI